MAGVKKEFKEALKDYGLWDEFVDTREQLKKSGVAPQDANKQTINIFEPRVAALAEGQPDPEITSESSEESAMSPEGEAADQGGLYSERCTEKAPHLMKNMALEGHPMLRGLDEESYAEFVNRKVDRIDIIEWVAKHLDIPLRLISLDNVPCAEALSMLLVYRSPLRRGDFFKDLYRSLIPSKTQLENHHTLGQIDGAGILDVCEKILKIKEKAEGSEDAGNENDA